MNQLSYLLIYLNTVEFSKAGRGITAKQSRLEQNPLFHRHLHGDRGIGQKKKSRLDQNPVQEDPV
jgi:hypothetical protein